MTGRWLLSFLALALALPGCAGGAALSSVGGTAFYRERIAMPPDAILEVSLEDVSRADAPATVLESVTIEEPGNVPVAFEISYDPDDIDEAGSYSVRARILVDGRPRWVSAAANPVLTRGNDDRVEILLVAAGDGADEGAGDESADALAGTRWTLAHLPEGAIASADSTRRPSLVFEETDDRLGGYSGCNQFGGTYRVGGATIEIHDLVSTLMACADGMDTERAFLAALEAARSWRIDGERLELYDGAGELLSRFDATSMD